ncbi:MAG TPA: GNAT family N-acetyltransferase [Saprospiraceae bacterium]|nr:GNAT family N-acetyltransferase [Saprospiraceae bacterium]HMQ85381.1 GNAT family N-acetyltransferase [Saprospiraceae bacterium]
MSIKNPLARVFFHCLPFQRLSVQELYDVMALRQKVFVVEQNCPYLDADGKDVAGYHLLGYSQSAELLACTRLLPKGVSYPDFASIGRVVSSPDHRGQGIGVLLMQESIRWCRQLFPDDPVKIGAQCYLTRFYESLGFEAVGDTYLEDGIPHIKMILKD